MKGITEKDIIAELNRQLPAVIRAALAGTDNGFRTHAAGDPLADFTPPSLGAHIRAGGDPVKAREIQRREEAERVRPMPAQFPTARSVTALSADDPLKGMAAPKIGDAIRANAGGSK